MVIVIKKTPDSKPEPVTVERSWQVSEQWPEALVQDGRGRWVPVDRVFPMI